MLTISNSPPIFPSSCFDQTFAPHSAETFLKIPSDFHIAKSWLAAPFSSPMSYLWHAGAWCSASLSVTVLAISSGLWSQGFKYHLRTPTTHSYLQLTPVSKLIYLTAHFTVPRECPTDTSKSCPELSSWVHPACVLPAAFPISVESIFIH